MEFALKFCVSARFEGKFFHFPAKMTVLEGYRQIRGIIDYGGDALVFVIAKVKHIKNREYFSRFENTFRHSAARWRAKAIRCKARVYAVWRKLTSDCENDYPRLWATVHTAKMERLGMKRKVRRKTYISRYIAQTFH